jgi:hypothetical protein
MAHLGGGRAAILPIIPPLETYPSGAEMWMLPPWTQNDADTW